MEMELGKLFIGGISWDTNEDGLREYFQAFGEVVEAVIMKDRSTGRARGFGFVVFADPAVAERVVMEKHLIDGRHVEAKKAVPREDQNILNRTNSNSRGSPGPTHTKKIFVGGLASTVTESDFKKYFDQFGTVTDVVVMYDHNTQRPRGFGFITYDSEEAVDKVLYKTFHELNGKLVEVKRAVPKESSPGSTRSQLGGSIFMASKVSNYLNGYTQGYNPSSLGGYGIRMDGRFSPVAVGRNNFSPIGPGYGLTLNYEQGLNPSYSGHSNISTSLGYGRLSPSSYVGNISRYGSPMGYGGGNIGSSFILNSTARNLWGNDSINNASSSMNSSSFLGPLGGNSRLNSFGSIGTPWSSSASPGPPGQGGRGDSFHSSGSFGNGVEDFNVGLGGRGYGQNNGRYNTPISSQTPANISYDRSRADIFEIDPFLGDSAWKSTPLDSETAGSFGFALGNGASDVLTSGSASYVGGYNFADRQTNRGIAA